MMKSFYILLLAMFVTVSSTSCLPSMPWASKEKIAFTVCTETNINGECSADIYMMKLSGKEKTRLTNTKDDNSMPRWSHDGYKLAFVSNRDGAPKIYVMKFDKSSYCRWGNCWITRLTTTPSGAGEQFPSWHPKNNTLIFQSTDIFGTIKLATAQFDPTADFLHSTEVSVAIDTNSSAPDYPKFPSWSPNGNRIAFVNEVNGKDTIFISRADGKEGFPITKPDSDNTMPAWSPDGQSIAFASNKDGDFNIYTINPDGTDLKKITTHAGNELEPNWSPDSETIVYTGDGTPTAKHPEAASREIFIINLTGKEIIPKRITHNSVDESYPAWAPKFEN